MAYELAGVREASQEGHEVIEGVQVLVPAGDDLDAVADPIAAGAELDGALVFADEGDLADATQGIDAEAFALGTS